MISLLELKWQQETFCRLALDRALRNPKEVRCLSDVEILDVSQHSDSTLPGC
jgi:hypothetical protein